MTDIFREVDEDLRRDRLEKLWKRYGALIVAVVLLVVAGTAGFVTWRNWQHSEAETKTQQLAEALRLAGTPAAQGGATGGDPKAAADALAAYAAQTGAGQGTLARFYEAGLRARDGDGAAATKIYDELAGSSAVAQVYRDLATLLSVTHQVQAGEPAQLRARLEPLTAESSPWRHSARELTALLAIRAGDKATAGKLFAQLQDDATAPSGVRNRATELAALYAAEPQ
ncbi:hypothetical protein N825_03170 [Skermanella stibiiresistens SB22]|uniref:Ancillary SecYEG translocon subunit/Cell division coordinator CpoB TPR domain-containing protein n=1 Tax=Skermanella stibiiresistens SB22 TaxID=1385369 RepID=W9H1E3_9PROT|nr:tetratricopeptide repeat protein [Skermanella stibiiresistens]EWY40005.1 hypothetical protein N825_03170 [Skermanella stibiiresistens SB22]